jgi:tRNA(fMet)-specific endonuclease VapC
VTLRFLLDTSVVSEPALASPNTRLIRRLEQRAGQCAIAALVWHELIYGVAGLPDGKRRSTLDYYVQSVVRDRFPILPYDLLAAEWHARERVRLEASGRATPFIDGQIAAIACTQNLVLVTSNTRHFAAFEDLEVADWSR